jgi:hypothetical protein
MPLKDIDAAIAAVTLTLTFDGADRYWNEAGKRNGVCEPFSAAH